jgi:hypothetical protein
MKYILKIMLLSIAVIPLFVWEALVYIWTFNNSGYKTLKQDYKVTVKSYYRKLGKRTGPTTF